MHTRRIKERRCQQILSVKSSYGAAVTASQRAMHRMSHLPACTTLGLLCIVTVSKIMMIAILLQGEFA